MKKPIKSPKVLKCSICEGDIEHQKDSDGKVFWTDGHNAQPVNNGRCCDACNWSVVIIARLGLLKGHK